MLLKPAIACFFLIGSTFGAKADDSLCYGTPAHRRVAHAKRLPASGSNFRAYSRVGVSLGRTYTHARVAYAIVDAYESLVRSAAAKIFVYGEAGFAKGGPFKPHRTHQNGLSVDFMVPVIDAKGRSVPLPGTAANSYGYDIEFDAERGIAISGSISTHWPNTCTRWPKPGVVPARALIG